MAKLVTDANVARPDDVYAWIIDLHDGLSEQESLRASAKLVLLLMNHIGDEQVIREAITAARRGLRSSPQEGGQ